jgi:hypothetical protein
MMQAAISKAPFCFWGSMPIIGDEKAKVKTPLTPARSRVHLSRSKRTINGYS